VAPAVKALIPNQPEVRLVDEGSGVEGVARLLGRHPRGGERPQLAVDERKQVGRSSAVSGRGRIEQAGHVGHSAESNHGVTEGNSKEMAWPPAAPPDGYITPGPAAPATAAATVVPAGRAAGGWVATKPAAGGSSGTSLAYSACYFAASSVVMPVQ
jgi:hypothetical protein